MVRLADKFDTWRPIEADDATIARALEEANIPALMAALVHVTGDTSLIHGDIRPGSEFFGDPQGGISEADQAKIRAVALDALKAYRDRGCTLPADPENAVIREIMDFLAGQDLPADYEAFLMSELGMSGEDPYWPPEIDRIPDERKRDFRVLVIGAGMSGLLAGYRLKQAGIPFTILEKNADVGGTWLENTYPGCRVDSPNHTYSYSFAPQDWPQHYSQQPVLLDYFQRCAEEMDVRDAIRFEVEAERADYDEASATWTVTVRTKAGGTETFTGNAIICAVGQLNRPRLPDIPGRDRFKGPSWHSARWEHEHDLTGKRIAVVGTGASAFQFVPRIAPDAAEVVIFQKSPPWVAPREEYYQDIPEGKHWLLNHVPYYAKWYRFLMFWRTAEGLLDHARKDPDWNDTDLAVGRSNAELRAMLEEFLKGVLADRPDLIESQTPQYPPAGKRMLVDDGTWLQTLKRDNVQVIQNPITEITEQGLVTADGALHEVDVIIYGTGFYANRIAWPIEFHGVGGLELQQHWSGDPKAYLGVSVPAFPNLFLMYGPNTNIVVNGSIIFFSECEMRYILGCLALLLEHGHAAMDCRQEVHDAYIERIDEGNSKMAWGAPNVSSWYKNEAGRVTQNWPFTLKEFWERTRRPDPADYHLIPPPEPARKRA
ncbi:MAG: hypothetical protein EA417_16620 [Gammaproteobacteria bacterium]|nr:MAG: hypothetical protein EA417_16620 [Gammaproteobacteria bacterium]